MAGISVIICCYNSAQRLPQTLKHLSLQQFAGHAAWEVIVVDNNSTDNTAELARAEWTLYQTGVPLKVIAEKQPGLSFARKSGVLAAGHEVVLFCDDDNWLSPGYLQNVLDIFAQQQKVAAVGGHGVPVTEQNMPLPEEWFGYYACGPQLNRGNKASEQYLYGAGLALRRNLLLQLYNAQYPFVLEDRKGGLLTSGGDTELTVLLHYLGYKLRYNPALVFQHYMPASRLQQSYFEQLRLGTSVSYYKLMPTLYVINGKKVSHFTWLADLFYQSKAAIITCVEEGRSKHFTVRLNTLKTVLANRKEYARRPALMKDLKNKFAAIL